MPQDASDASFPPSGTFSSVQSKSTQAATPPALHGALDHHYAFVEDANGKGGVFASQSTTEAGRDGLNHAVPPHPIPQVVGDLRVPSHVESNSRPKTSAPVPNHAHSLLPTVQVKRASESSEAGDPTSRPSPPKKARTQLAPPRKIDLTDFTRPLTHPKIEEVTSPLFFSNTQRPAIPRPPSFSGSEAAGSMLSRVREGADVTTLKLARGTVSSASPARSSSTPGSWTSIDAVSFAKSPDMQTSTPGYQALHNIGIIELLERDDRPTFVIDGTHPANNSAGPFSFLYMNPALHVAESLRHLLQGEFQDDGDVKTEFSNFKSWVRNAGQHPEGADVFLPSYHYGGIDWTCSIVRNRFRFISANRSAASIARTSPEPPLEREASVDSRIRGGTPNAQPKTPSDISIPDRDYFGSVAVESTETPTLPTGSDITDPVLLRRNSDYDSEILTTSTLQPSFDWTRIPLTQDLPRHIQFARTVDWASTPLGPVETWTADLRAMANMVMGSPHPAAMYWGREYTTIYNEAYIAIAGKKHPKLMGQSYKEAWGEIWPEIAPVFDSAWESGQATMKNDDRFIVNRHGFQEETFFSWSVVPLVGEDGSVMGLYNPAFENTRRKVAERRMLTLREVGERTATARDVKTFWSEVYKGLEYNEEDIPFILVYSVSEDSDSDVSSMHSGSIANPPQLNLEAAIGVPQGHPCLTSALDLKSSSEGFAPYMRDSMSRAGQAIVLSEEDGTLPSDLMDDFEWRGGADPCRAIVIFPVHPTTGSDNVVGFIVMGVNPRRPYDDDYQLFISLLSRQLATSLASVVLFEEEIKRGQKAARLAALDKQELTEQLHLRTQEVEESELKFTRMAAFAPVGMFIADQQGRINYCNDTWWEISRHPPTKGGINTWMESVRDEDRPGLQVVWQKLVAERSAITHEFRFKCSRVERESVIDTWVLLSAYPETDGLGGLKGIFGCITDISQQKLAQQIQAQRREEAVELKRQQENFIDITSHEMRNPLSAILQSADEIVDTLTKHRANNDPKHETDALKITLDGCLEAANTITLCASHQKRIVDDILTLSKLDSQLLLVTPVDVQPLAVVQRVLKMFEGELNTNGIQMKFIVKNRYLDMGVNWVKLDPSRLLQVLINLITNAIKFTQACGTRSIVVRLDASTNIQERTDSDISFFQSDRQDDDDLTNKEDWGTGEKINLHFSVEDTGRGLDEHERKLLFQRFSQTTPRTHVQYGGSGLGLFISRILTELQGGQIGVKSQKGVGSTFSFYVRSRKTVAPPDVTIPIAPPLTRAPGSSTTIENRQPKHSGRGQLSVANKNAAARPRTADGQRLFDVLIVEDNVVNQKVLQKQLRNIGNNTQVANHGGEALEALKRSRFWSGQERSGEEISVILMDLEMPVMDGMTCARKIRELEREGTIVSHIPIIAVTAYARPEQIEDAKAAGIDDVISKPFRMPELMPRIEDLVDRFTPSQIVAN